jgi:AcrR family transcriptional regulator
MRDGAATKQKIDRTALGLFVRQGVAETTIRHIATGAGIAEGTIYRHYESKDALVRSLFSSHYAAFALTLEKLQAREDHFKAKLDAMIHGFCRFFDEDWELFGFLLVTQHEQLRRLEPGRPNPVNVIQRVVETAEARGEIPNGNASLTTALLLGVVLQPAIFRIYGRLDGPLSGIAREISSAAWRIVSPDAAPTPSRRQERDLK